MEALYYTKESASANMCDKIIINLKIVTTVVRRLSELSPVYLYPLTIFLGIFSISCLLKNKKLHTPFN